MTKFVPMRHSVTGKVGDYPESYLDHPVLGQYLTPCPDAGCDSCGVQASEPEPEPQPEPEPILAIPDNFQDYEVVE